jgi:hypothetical protein
MSQNPSYFSGWEFQEQECSKCGWVGLGSEAGEELFFALVEVNCPACDGRLFTVPLPTDEQVAEAAAKGIPQAVSMFLAAQQREMFLVRRNYTLLRDGEGLPDIDGDELDFYLTLWDLHGETWLVLGRGDGQGADAGIDSLDHPNFLHFELAQFENTEPVGRIARVLRSRYGSRFRYLYTRRALLYLGGDNLSAASQIRSTLGPHTPPSADSARR